MKQMSVETQMELVEALTSITVWTLPAGYSDTTYISVLMGGRGFLSAEVPKGFVDLAKAWGEKTSAALAKARAEMDGGVTWPT